MLVVHRQNLKIVLSELSRQPSFAAEHFDTNYRANRFAGPSALLIMSIGPFPTLLPGVRLEALDALMYTFHTPQLTLFGVGRI